MPPDPDQKSTFFLRVQQAVAQFGRNAWPERSLLKAAGTKSPAARPPIFQEHESCMPPELRFARVPQKLCAR